MRVNGYAVAVTIHSVLCVSVAPWFISWRLCYNLTAMTLALLLSLLAGPAAANPAAMTATLEALRSEASVDPAALSNRESAAVQSGKGFDGSFTIQTLVPVEYVPLTGAPRKNPPPAPADKPEIPRPKEEVPPAPQPGTGDGTNTDYYFRGTKPLNGITIYTPVKGEGSTSGGESPTDKYGQYGKYAIIGGVALLAVGLLLGGAPLVVGALLGGLLIGAGAVLSFLFGKKK